MLASVDWTSVLDSLIASLPAIMAALGALTYSHRAHGKIVDVHGEIQTPSGDPLGHVVERAHDLAAVTTMAVTSAETEATPALGESVQRLNGDDHSPVHVNGLETKEAKP